MTILHHIIMTAATLSLFTGRFDDEDDPRSDTTPVTGATAPVLMDTASPLPADPVSAGVIEVRRAPHLAITGTHLRRLASPR